MEWRGTVKLVSHSWVETIGGILMAELVNRQPGQLPILAVTRQPSKRDAVINFTSYSCTEEEHWRCSISPLKPIPGRGLSSDDLAPRCVCDCHYTTPLGTVNSMEIIYDR